MRYRDDDPLFYVRKHRSFRGLIVILLIIMIFSVSVVLVNAFINRQVQAVSRSVTIPSLPSSLEEAIRELRKDHDFLTVNGVFPESLIETWIEALEKDIAKVNNIPHPAEFDLYYDL